MFSEVGKGRVQKRTREKLPVDVPVENQEPNLEVPAPPAKEAEMASCPKASASAPSSRLSPQETTVANPQQPTQPRETKCVRISEEPPVTIPKQPRSVELIIWFGHFKCLSVLHLHIGLAL